MNTILSPAPGVQPDIYLCPKCEGDIPIQTDADCYGLGQCPKCGIRMAFSHHIGLCTKPGLKPECAVSAVYPPQAESPPHAAVKAMFQSSRQRPFPD